MNYSLKVCESFFKIKTANLKILIFIEINILICMAKLLNMMKNLNLKVED